MPPRSSWKGFLRLSLVSVPVKAFTAHETGSEIRLNQLHTECHGRIRYQKVCAEHGEVPASDIVSGFEYGKGQYVVVDPDDLQKLRPQSDKTVGIHGFIPTDALDPVYFAGRTYYLAPDGPAGERPYALLLRGMKDAGLCAIAEVILAGREQIVLVRPMGGLLAMSVLHYQAKLKSIEPVAESVSSPEFSEQELELTRTLIAASTIEAFDFTTYRDTYVDNLRRLIDVKIEGKEIVCAPDVEEPKIMNLMEALKQSVAAAQQSAPIPRKKATSKKSAAAKKTAN